ncbi:DUF3558 domain-containing protein [Rhodococcus sp. I2R]|nr:DUF3558 domain-containing protein [Rhodococcus sp. I2R]
MATLVAVATLLVGCGGGVEGSPLAAERWDPCSIPASAMEATGLDPTYVSAGWGEGISVPDWSLCTLRGPSEDPSYFFNVKSSESRTIAEARSDDSHLHGIDLAVGGRDAFKFRTQMSRSITDCNIAVAVPPGVVVFSVDSMGTKEIGGDPCELVYKHTTELVSLLPPA